MAVKATPNPNPAKRKRLPPKKPTINTSPSQNITIEIEEVATTPVTKKRAAKKSKVTSPTAAPIIDSIIPPQPIANIILHLKCSMQDLNEHNVKMSQLVTDPLLYNPTVPPSILSYNSIDNTTFSSYEPLIAPTIVDHAYSESEVALGQTIGSLCQPVGSLRQTIGGLRQTVGSLRQTVGQTVGSLRQTIGGLRQTISQHCQKCNHPTELDQSSDQDLDPYIEDNMISMKDVKSKLKKLKLQVYKNTNPDKKSACFWCTCDFENEACYIPKCETDDEIFGYGSFCRPECAAAFLMKENIDDSTKFERYHLLNQSYSKAYHYKKNIKPAPNPYYLLDKFYGNLSIQEYRKLLRSEHTLLVIDKPMTRILPELHEDSEDFVLNIYGGKTSLANQGGVYKVKRQSEKPEGPSKTSIMKDTFSVNRR